MTPTNAQVATSSNWMTSGSLYNFVKPQNNPKLTNAFGSQDVTGLMEKIGGGKNPVSGLSFRHFEEDRLDAVVYAAGTAGAAGIAVIYTLVAGNTDPESSTITGFPSVFDPYLSDGGAPILNPVRLGQNITFSNGAKGTVTLVTPTAFTAVPDKIAAGAGNVLPTQTGVEPIVLGSIVNGEAGDQPKALNFRLNMIEGVMQINNETALTTGSALGVESWIDNFESPDGKVGSVWYFKNQTDALKRLKNQREIDCVSGEAVTNDTTLATFNPTLLKTSGLLTFAKSYSASLAYTIGSLALTDFEDLIIDGIDKNRGADENSVWCSIKLRQEIDRFIRPEMNQGGILYGSSLGTEQNYVNFGFRGFSTLGKTFHLKTYQVFNNPTMLGAITKYQNCGVLIPMDTSIERMGDTKEKIETPAFRMNYVQQGSTNRELQEWLTGSNGRIYNTTTDIEQYNLRTHFGFEGFRPNAYAFLQGS